MLIHSQYQVACVTVFVGSVLTHASLGAGFQLLHGLVHGVPVCFYQAIVFPKTSHDRNGLGRRDGEVVEIPPALRRAVGRHAIDALALTQKFASVRAAPLA